MRTRFVLLLLLIAGLAALAALRGLPLWAWRNSDDHAHEGDELVVVSHDQILRRAIDSRTHEPEHWREIWQRRNQTSNPDGPSEAELYVLQSVDATASAERSWKRGEVRIHAVFDSRRFMGGRGHPDRTGGELPTAAGCCNFIALRVGERSWNQWEHAWLTPIRATFAELPTASIQTDLPPGTHEGVAVLAYQWVNSCRYWELPIRFDVADGRDELDVDRVREALSNELVAEWTSARREDPCARLSIRLRWGKGERRLAPMDMCMLQGDQPRRWSRRIRASPDDAASHVLWEWGLDRASTPPVTVSLAIDRVLLESPEFGGRTGIASGLKLELELPVAMSVADAANGMASVGTASDKVEASGAGPDNRTTGESNEVR